MSTAFLVNTCINDWCVKVIPVVLFELILLYFDSSDKFAVNSIKCEDHLFLDSNDKSIKKLSCNNLYCKLDQIALLTQIICCDCYHWIFKLSKIPYDCSVGIFGKCDDKITERESIFLELDYLDVYTQFSSNDILEMVLNFDDNLLLFFKCDNKYIGHRLLIYSFNLSDDCICYCGGIEFTSGVIGCFEDGFIELIDSGYIEAPKCDKYECVKTFLR